MKSLAFNVLRRLADGEFHSGNSLAQDTGMSRASVWNAVQQIEAAGVEVFRVRGRGYRLAQPLALLDAADVTRRLDAAAPWSVEIFDSVDSTSTLLMQRVQSGAVHATVIAAELQSAGRGRMRRAWHSAPGGALTFSLLWRFAQGAGALAGLSLAVGVALARGLRKVCTESGAHGDTNHVVDIGLKWPNDVLWRGRKLAGILVEMQGEAQGPSEVVIGIGINVRLSTTIDGRIDQPAADLESICGSAINRNALLALLLTELGAVLAQFEQTGFAVFRAAWQQLHVHQGGDVALTMPDGARQHGVARGVADDGALLLQTSAGLQRFHSGEIVASRGATARSAAVS